MNRKKWIIILNVDIKYAWGVPIPAVIGPEAGYTLDWATQRQTPHRKIPI